MSTSSAGQTGRPRAADWLEPTIELPSHAAMGTNALTVSERIARTTTAHPNHTSLAFDANGYLVDWQAIDSDRWANDTAPEQRAHVFAGGANHSIVDKSVRAPAPGAGD